MKHLLTLILAMLITLAGFSQTVTTQVTLTGSGTDADGTIVSYFWRQISGPAIPTIVSPASATTIVKGYSVPGIYLYELTVTDNRGGVGKDTMQVTVLQAANKPPKANAGGDIIIQMPQATSFNLIQEQGTPLQSIKRNSRLIVAQIWREGASAIKKE